MWLLLLVFTLVFAESAILLDLIVPGDVGLVVAGAAAAENGTPLAGVVAAAALGAVAGDSFGYVLGRRFGEGLVDRWAWTRKRLAPTLDRCRDQYQRWGAWSVAVARWVGALRAVVPIVAGTAGLAVHRFLLADVPSAILWATAVATVGFMWGDDIAQFVDQIGLAISIVAVLVIAALVWRARRRQPA